MKDVDQIAAEAYDELMVSEGSSQNRCKSGIAIIQAAIEEATNQIKDERDDALHLLTQERNQRAVERSMIEALREEIKGLRGEVDGWKWVKVEDTAHASEIPCSKQAGWENWKIGPTCITCGDKFSGSWSGECPKCEQRAIRKFIALDEEPGY